VSDHTDDDMTRTGPMEDDMPLVDIQLIEGVFDADQKRRMIADVTDAMVAIEGEAMRGLTWVRVQEIASGELGIGGKPMTAADVEAAQAQPA
jgi:4-oxalocrotonate tautomerase